MSTVVFTFHDTQARDVGFLLEKHPDRVFTKELSDELTVELTWGHADTASSVTVEAKIHPLKLARGSTHIDGYVNDHPWTCGSMFWQAFSKVFRSALGGKTRGDAALVEKKWSVSVRFGAINARPEQVQRFFWPLDYVVELSRVLDSSIYTVDLRHDAITVKDLFRHCYVLGMALDSRRHFGVTADQLDKLLQEASDWLPQHPLYNEITKGFMGAKGKLSQAAISAVEALVENDAEEGEAPAEESPAEEVKHPKLSELRREEILKRLQVAVPIPDPENPPLVVELGCGNGRLCEAMAQAGYRVLGIDQDGQRLSQAAKWVRRNKVERVGFELSNILYKLPPITLDAKGRPRFSRKEQDTLLPVAAVVCTEVVEHIVKDSLPLFWSAALSTGAEYVILTTPNRDYNTLYGLGPLELRDRDHKFEWGTDLFEAQADLYVSSFGYTVEDLYGIGPTAQEFVNSKAVDQSGTVDYAEEMVSLNIIPNTQIRPTSIAVLSKQEEAIVFPWPHPGMQAAYHVQGLSQKILIPWEQRAQALSMLSSAAPIKRVPFIPPTMSPVDAAQTGELEAIEDALRYYAERGVERVIFEKKHMGSRGVAYFAPDGTGALYTRTGRMFSPEIANPILSALYKAMGEPRWALVDGEVLPWGAKAEDLIARSFEPCGAALLADSSLYPDRLGQRLRATAFMRQLWLHSANQEPVRFAPFAVLGGPAPFDIDHAMQMKLIGDWVAKDATGRLEETPWFVFDTAPSSYPFARMWWNAQVALGAEGVVVKPYGGLDARGAGGDYIQPGIKVRNREYLRIIYGPLYEDYLDQLRERGTKRKRRLALQQHALGMAGLRALVDAGGYVTPDVHAYVFATLALDAEPMDPRL